VQVPQWFSASEQLLQAKAPDEAENFRATIATMTAAAMRSHHGEPLPNRAPWHTRSTTPWRRDPPARRGSRRVGPTRPV